MARIRTIKPEFQNSASMGRVSREARLTFILLWPQCDDAGRIRANSRMLSSILFPYDEDAPILIDKWLSELERDGCIVRYSVANEEYLAISAWAHQKIDHPSPSKLPAPPEKKRKKTKTSSREAQEKPRERSPVARALSSTVSSTVSDQTLPEPEAPAAQETFVDFWNAFPKQVDELNAREAYALAITIAAPAVILAGAKRYRATVRRDKPEERFIKSPRTWLEDRRWTDGVSAGTAAASAFESPEEQAAQRAMMEKHYGQA